MLFYNVVRIEILFVVHWRFCNVDMFLKNKNLCCKKKNQLLTYRPVFFQAERQGFQDWNPHRQSGGHPASITAYHWGGAQANTATACTPRRHGESPSSLKPQVHWVIPREGNDPAEFLENLLLKAYGRDAFSVMFAVDRAHHILARPPPQVAPPHTFIAKFLNFRDRDRILCFTKERQHPCGKHSRCGFPRFF